MEDGLEEILGLSGVKNCMLFDNQGEPLYVVGSERFTDEKLRMMGESLLYLLGSLNKSQVKDLNLDFIYEKGSILIRDLEDAVLAVIADGGADLSMMRMTINIVQQQWKESADIQKRLRRMAAARELGDAIPSSREEFTQS